MNLLKARLDENSDVYEVKQDENVFVFKVKQPFSLAHFNKTLVEQGVFVSHLVKRKKTLEKRFLEVLKQNA